MLWLLVGVLFLVVGNQGQEQIQYQWEILNRDTDDYTQRLSLLNELRVPFRSHDFLSPVTQKRFSCRIPYEPSEKEEEEEKEPEVSASDLLGTLPSCVYKLEGWWTYEFCYGEHMRQYHANADGTIPVDANFYLGLAQIVSPSLGQKEIDKGITHADHHQEIYNEGTLCDLTGKPREVDMRFYCGSSTEGATIVSIKEPSSCKYQVRIETPLLCKLPKFQTTPEVPKATIWCFETPLPTPEELAEDVKKIADIANAKQKEKIVHQQQQTQEALLRAKKQELDNQQKHQLEQQRLQQEQEQQNQQQQKQRQQQEEEVLRKQQQKELEEQQQQRRQELLQQHKQRFKQEQLKKLQQQEALRQQEQQDQLREQEQLEEEQEDEPLFDFIQDEEFPNTDVDDGDSILEVQIGKEAEALLNSLGIATSGEEIDQEVLLDFLKQQGLDIPEGNWDIKIVSVDDFPDFLDDYSFEEDEGFQDGFEESTTAHNEKDFL